LPEAGWLVGTLLSQHPTLSPDRGPPSDARCTNAPPAVRLLFFSFFSRYVKEQDQMACKVAVGTEDLGPSADADARRDSTFTHFLATFLCIQLPGPTCDTLVSWRCSVPSPGGSSITAKVGVHGHRCYLPTLFGCLLLYTHLHSR
jgi:hypothetical protein